MAKRKTPPPITTGKPKVEKHKVAVKNVVDKWLAKIEGAKVSEDRRCFMSTAKQCHQFYAGSFAFMWDDNFRKNYFGSIPAPRFKFTIAKAFEAVAIMGPSIMWDYPGRVIKSLKKFKLPQEAFMSQDEYDEYLQEFEQESVSEKIRNGLMQTYLNWSHREQPGGGMIIDSHKAITEAIVKGRGVLFTGTYKHPSGNDRVFTKSEFVTVDDLYLDPDCRNANLTDCYWIAIRRQDKYWELERRFGLEEDSMKDMATLESINSATVNDNMLMGAKRKSGLNGEVCDVVEWYEIFSKEGIGNRNKRFQSDENDTLDDVVGDFAYLAICPKCDYPLNFAPNVSRKANEEAIKKAFDWPIPYYMDGRWPVSLLDFYTQPNSAWPLAPLAMGLGELYLLNIVISCLADRVYEGLRSVKLVSDEISADVLKRLKDIDYSGWVEVPTDIPEKINNLIREVESSGIDQNVWGLIDRISDQFDKRTGLIGRLYGDPSGQPRSAAESEYQNAATTTRPDWMGRMAEAWQTDVANNERIAAGWSVEGSSLVPLLGRKGAELWDQAFEDPETYLLQMDATLEANSIKKPNKFRDNANLQQVSSYLLPLFDRYFQMTGNTGPMNNFIGALADAMEQDDPSAWMLPEMPPPEPKPEEEIATQAAQENLKGKQLRNTKLERELGPPPPMVGGEQDVETMTGMPPQQFAPAMQMPFPAPRDLSPVELGMQ